MLASLTGGTIPMAANGYTGGVNESSDEDALYSKAWPSTDEKGA